MTAVLKNFCFTVSVFASINFLTPPSTYAQGNVNIVVAAAIHEGKCGGISWDYLGYVYFTGSGLCSDLRSKSVSDVYKLHPDANRVRVECSFGDPCVWIATPLVGVLKSTDGGTSWSVTGLSFGLSSFVCIRQLIINPSAPGTLPAAAGNGIYRTTNSDSTRTLRRTANAVDVRFKPGDPNTVYACTGSQKLYASINQP